MDAAFSFYNEPHFKSFSMNDLAVKVGISKPAIYRHYKDKDAVIAAMYEQFVDMLATCLLKVQEEADQNKTVSVPTFASLIQFFAEHPYYINYMMGNMCAQDDFEKQIVIEMTKRGVKDLVGYGILGYGDTDATIKDMWQYVRGIYCGVTIFIFIKLREKWVQQGEKAESLAVFSENVVRAITGGFKTIAPADHILHPAEISEKRFAQLDALCTIGDDVLPPENRIFTALAKTIVKYKFTGVTVDKIAAELNMAKSSLYEYFDNKNQMIKSLIVRELTLMTTIIKENSAEAHNFSEYLYILLRTELSYFTLRPSIIPVCGWLLQSTTDDPFAGDFDATNQWVEKLPDPLVPFSFGMAVHPQQFLAWVSSLPVALVVQGANRSLDGQTLLQALKMIFQFLEYGTDR